MNSRDLKKWIIVPTLNILGLYDKVFLEKNMSQIRLLAGTAAVETDLGKYVRQLGYSTYEGGGFGIYSIERVTHDAVLEWLRKNKPNMYLQVLHLRTKDIYIRPEEELIFNLYYSTAIARGVYLSISEPLPAADDIVGLASYYKKYYNRNGKATAELFIEKFRQYEC